MTIVNTETGELVELDRAAAERRAERITLRLDAIADNYRAVLPMIREAIQRRDDLALGYRSPGDYVSDRFGQALAGLGLEVRRAVVGELTEAGLSTRAIAPVVGISHVMVKKDQDAGVNRVNTSNTSATFEDRGNAERESDDAAVVAQTESGASPAAHAEAEVGIAPAPRTPVTGIDGKTYTRPATPVAKPEPAPRDAEYDNAAQACLGLTRAMSRLLTFEHPNMRAGMRAYWSLAADEVPPVQRRDVTPEQMRVAARGLLELADEWESK